jgi:ATP-binding cassette subfamily G (WHITE) protein 2 (PDR)
MGATGARKTTLLDVRSQKTSTGVSLGSRCYLPTSIVREALQFGALLRQTSHIPESERLTHVEEMIEVLEMHSFADALVGVSGQSLNVEQRKWLTIGVELAEKPE